MKEPNEVLCIYHGNCPDGFGAAWIVNKYYKLYFPDWKVEFFPGFYGVEPPDVTGKIVVIVDFSYKRPVLLDMASRAYKIIVIDHHVSAKEDLAGIESEHDMITSFFDMGHSGCVLTWQYFFYNRVMPGLLKTIEDRDLWKFELPRTQEIMSALFSYEYDFGIWTDLMYNKETDDLVAEGTAIYRKHIKDIKELIKVSARETIIAGYEVPIINMPYTMASDACHIMAEGRPFAVAYYDAKDHRVYSLRSLENGVDVSKIAAAYGGGGHKHAAGFKLDFDQVPDYN